MSRHPLQGRVEEVVYPSSKPSLGSRIGEVLGSVISAIGSAVREYGPSVLKGLANASLYESSSSAYRPYDISSSSLPDYSSKPIQISVPQPIKPRPLPEPIQSPRLMETYGKKLQVAQERNQERLARQMELNHEAANRSGLARHLGTPGFNSQSNQGPHQAPIETYSTDNQAYQLLDQVLNPRSQAAHWVQENPSDWQQAGQRPVSYSELFKAQAEQAQLRNDPMEDYMRQKREHEQNRRQIQASLRTPGISDLMTNNQKPALLPDDYFLNPQTGQLDPGRILQAGRMPDDKQLKNLFLRADVELCGAKTDFERLQAQQKLQLVKDTLANLMAGRGGLISRDGYVIIGNQAYGQNEAIYKALQDIEHFYAHGEHLPALKYPTIPPENINPRYHREVYPNVTQDYQKFLNGIVQETKAVLKSEGKIVFDGVKPNFKKGVYGLFGQNFPNNGKWDTQVGHGFPGQVVLRDPKTGEALPHPDSSKYPGRVVTIDQYALFKGKPVRAGYLSNYAFGYAAAAGRLHLDDSANSLVNLFANEVGNTVAYANIKSGQFVDNSEDTQAIKEGYEAYWREHPHEKRTKDRHEGYRSQ